MKQLHMTLTLLPAVVFRCGILLAAPLQASPDTLDRYVIDNRQVEQFDGSQLEGRKVVSYQVSTVSSSPEDAIRIHDIRTESASKSSDPVYVIDGKMVPKRRFENMNPSRIKSITVVKNGSVEEVRQYPGWENGVILVETKKGVPLANKKDTQIKIGYGEADSRDLPYSVASVKQDDNVFYTNMYEYLRGKVAGVQLGADNSIFIRGKGTFNSSSEPLILVDGVEVSDLNTISPYDVYSVDVLKDASASIYGIKGANGVILITTKLGRQVKEQEASAKSKAKAGRAGRKAQKGRNP